MDQLSMRNVNIVYWKYVLTKTKKQKGLQYADGITGIKRKFHSQPRVGVDGQGKLQEVVLVLDFKG